MFIVNKNELVEDCFYWLTGMETNLKDIGCWDGYKFSTCLHYDGLYWSEVYGVSVVAPTGE